jgi:hypothetical protein
VQANGSVAGVDRTVERSRAALALSGAVVVALLLAAVWQDGRSSTASVVAGAPPAKASQPLATFTNPGSYTWIVPTGTKSISVDAYGAEGGGHTAGLGGRATATLEVVPGQALQIVVGGMGVVRQGGDGDPSSTYSYNGGGLGSLAYGSGGGASDVRVGPCASTRSCTLGDRVVVAGGGGGVAASGGVGGAGGGLVGGSGHKTGGASATGGTQSAGGAPSSVAEPDHTPPGLVPTAGTFGGGGRAGQLGGGGGGGWFGGGGGTDRGSGGGGSSHIDPLAAGGITQAGVGIGNGHVTITKPAYPVPVTTTTAVQPELVMDDATSTSDWDAFDFQGWWQCPTGRVITGFYTSGATGLYQVEMLECSTPTAVDGTIFSLNDDHAVDWSTSFDQAGLSTVDDGSYITGFYRSTCQPLYCLEEASAAHPAGLSGWSRTVEVPVAIGTTAAWHRCPAGTALVGLRRGTDNQLSSIAALRCATTHTDGT